MSRVSGPTGAPGSSGYISDAPAEPAPGERLLSDPPPPLAPGERLLSDGPAPVAPGERLLSDMAARPGGERLISDPPPDTDQFLSAPGSNVTAAKEPTRTEATASDYVASAANNVGNFFEDLWDKNYGDAARNAGQAIMDTGSALHEALFGDNRKKPG